MHMRRMLLRGHGEYRRSDWGSGSSRWTRVLFRCVPLVQCSLVSSWSNADTCLGRLRHCMRQLWSSRFINRRNTDVEYAIWEGETELLIDGSTTGRYQTWDHRFRRWQGQIKGESEEASGGEEYTGGHGYCYGFAEYCGGDLHIRGQIIRECPPLPTRFIRSSW